MTPRSRFHLYPIKDSAMLGIWLACANTDEPACINICDLVMATDSSATSTSLIRLLDAERFSLVVARLRTVLESLF